MSCWVRLNGNIVATEIAAHTPPTWETLADGGNGEASFALAASLKADSVYLKPGTLMEIFYGSRRVWIGRIVDWDRESGRVVGRGIQADAYGIPALDGGGNVTRDIGTAIATAVVAPWTWLVNNYDGVAGAATGTVTEPIMIGQLLDQVAQQTGMRWGQKPNTNLYMTADPTSPTWLATPESSVFGTTNESRPTHLVAVYFNGSANAKTIRGSGTPANAELVDLTEKRGTLTLAEANAILDNALAKLGARNGWVNGSTLQSEQLTTIGGTPAALAAVRAGAMVRALGVAYAGMSTSSPDMVIGKTRYTAGEDTIYLEPANTAPRTLADVIAAA